MLTLSPPARARLTTVLAGSLVFLSSATGLIAQAPPGVPGGEPTPEGAATPDPRFPLPSSPDFETITYWKAEMPGGKYIVAHDSINGVSMQEYVLDGAARVTEVNVSTSGVMQPRFYYIEPLNVDAPTSAGGSVVDRAQSALEDAASRVVPGDPVWAKVVKSYPTTTHAGTIEFRVESKEQLKNLYESLEDSWIKGRSEIFRAEGAGRTLTPREEKEEKSEEGQQPTGDSGNDADAFGGL